jgi:hypothetical protein
MEPKEPGPKLKMKVPPAPPTEEDSHSTASQMRRSSPTSISPSPLSELLPPRTTFRFWSSGLLHGKHPKARSVAVHRMWEEVAFSSKVVSSDRRPPLDLVGWPLPVSLLSSERLGWSSGSVWEVYDDPRMRSVMWWVGRHRREVEVMDEVRMGLLAFLRWFVTV